MDVLGRSLPRAEPLLKLTGLDLQEGAEEADVGEQANLRLNLDKTGGPNISAPSASSCEKTAS